MVREPAASVLISSSAEAAAGALSVAADGKSGSALTWVDDQSVAALHYSLLGREYDPDQIDPSILGNHDLVYTYNQLHGGWLFRFPDAVVEKLARLDGRGFDAVVDRWEPAFRGYAHPPERAALAEMLRQFVALAKAAGREGKLMYWLAPGC
jgi:hypothetical protein